MAHRMSSWSSGIGTNYIYPQCYTQQFMHSAIHNNLNSWLVFAQTVLIMSLLATQTSTACPSIVVGNFCCLQLICNRCCVLSVPHLVVVLSLPAAVLPDIEYLKQGEE